MSICRLVPMQSNISSMSLATGWILQLRSPYLASRVPMFLQNMLLSQSIRWSKLIVLWLHEFKLDGWQCQTVHGESSINKNDGLTCDQNFQTPDSRCEDFKGLQGNYASIHLVPCKHVCVHLSQPLCVKKNILTKMPK